MKDDCSLRKFPAWEPSVLRERGGQVSGHFTFVVFLTWTDSFIAVLLSLHFQVLFFFNYEKKIKRIAASTFYDVLLKEISSMKALRAGQI